MSITVGFVILSHRPGGQLLRLIQMLNREYEVPQIAVHHDFGQASLDTAGFGSNVRFVKPHLPTRWGRFTLVEAVLAGIELLYRDGGPDWFFLLSAQDFPVMRGKDVSRELENCNCDALIDLRPLDPEGKAASEITGAENPRLSFYSADWNREMKRRFYLSPQLWFPVLRSNPVRIGKKTFRPNVGSGHPYGAGFECFFGDMWFGANRKAAHVLLEPTDKHRALQQHFRKRTFSDESYWHTVLANTPGLCLHRDNRRYARWAGNSGPETLGEGDLDDILASDAFFARKFEESAPVLDQIEEHLAVASNPLRDGPDACTA